MNWLSKLFNSGDQRQNQASDTLPLYIEGDYLYYQNNQNMEAAQLEYATYCYATVLGGVPYLMFFAGRQHYISSKQQGFDKVYAQLSRRYGFDDQAFHHLCKKPIEDKKVLLWRQTFPKNYQILTDPLDVTDEGFELYGEHKRIVSWDTTYEEMERLEQVEVYTSESDYDYLHFTCPVRIGQLVVEHLEIFKTGSLPDRAVAGYFAKLVDESNTDKSYYDVRNLFLKGKEPKSKWGYERDDQKHLEIPIAKDIYISITYTYAENSGMYDDGMTYFSIDNRRRYPHLLNNAEYEQKMEIDGTLIFQKQYAVQRDYHTNNAVKHIPEVIRQEFIHKSGLWVDRQNNVVGCVGEDTAYICSIDVIHHFEIENILPAKGPGYSIMAICLIDGGVDYIFEGVDTYEFDGYASDIEQLTGKKVVIPQAYYNC